MTTPYFEIEFQFQITHSLRFVKSLIALKSRLRNCHCEGTPACRQAGKQSRFRMRLPRTSQVLAMTEQLRDSL